MEEYAREPCPYRIVDDCGGAFAMGCIGGGVFQAIKGFRNAPSGFNRRMVCNWQGQIIARRLYANLFVDWQSNGYQNQITNYCRKFRCLGRHVQHYRLYVGAFPEKRRSLELNN